MSGRTQTLTERVAAPFHGVTVDREAGVIRNVLLCGVESANKRKYPWGSTLKHRKGMYERKVGYLGHDAKKGQLCWIENERTDEQGRPRGDLHVYKSHPDSARVFEAAERNAPEFGLSHVAECKTRTENGWLIVESVERVERVDVVEGPATVSGFRESKQGANVTTIKQLLETLAPRLDVSGLLRLKRLSEMDGGMYGDAPVEPMAADADPKDGITAAFQAAAYSVVDEMIASSADPAKVKELAGKLRKLIASHGDVNGDGTVDAADVDAADDDTDEMKVEGKKAQPNGAVILEALAVAERVGLKADKSDLLIIAATPTADREAVAKRLKEATGTATGGPRTTPRGGGTQTTKASESKQGTTTLPESIWLS